MKKFLTGIMIAVMAMSLCACGGSDNSNDNASNEKTVDNDGESNKDTNESSAKEGDLKLLCTLDSKGARCDTDTGYYYITEEYEELEDGNWGGHIMYMDYATQQEVYLCNDAGCNHMNKDCNSVILEGDYMVFSTLLFTQNNKLYFLSKEQDQEGSLDTNLMIGGETESNEVVSQPCVLYEANLDGTDRHKVYTFDQGLTLEDYVLGDGKGIYVVTKNIQTTAGDAGTYSTATNKQLVYLNLESCKEENVCSMDFNDQIDWKVVNCYGNKLVMEGVDYGGELSYDELTDDQAYVDKYKASKEIFATFTIGDDKPKEFHRINNDNEYSTGYSGNTMYLSCSNSGDINEFNMDNGESRLIANTNKNYIYCVMGDTLCLHSWDWTDDSTLDFVNVESGEVKTSSLVNKYNGWSLEIQAVNQDDVLVIYDYEADYLGDDTYEIHAYKYALISKADLIAGNDAYKPISMIKGGK